MTGKELAGHVVAFNLIPQLLFGLLFGTARLVIGPHEVLGWLYLGMAGLAMLVSMIGTCIWLSNGGSHDPGGLRLYSDHRIKLRERQERERERLREEIDKQVGIPRIRP